MVFICSSDVFILIADNSINWLSYSARCKFRGEHKKWSVCRLKQVGGRLQSGLILTRILVGVVSENTIRSIALTVLVVLVLISCEKDVATRPPVKQVPLGCIYVDSSPRGMKIYEAGRNSANNFRKRNRIFLDCNKGGLNYLIEEVLMKFRQNSWKDI